MDAEKERARHALTKLVLRGFKTFDEPPPFEPRALNVLIGANGAGKSNFISFLRMVGWIATGHLQHYVGEAGAHRLLHDGPQTTREIAAEFTFESEEGWTDYEFRLAYGAGDALFFADERFRFRDRSAEGECPWQTVGSGHRESGLGRLRDEGDEAATTLLSLLRRCGVVYQFNNTSSTSRMRQKWRMVDRRYLKEDGGNLAPFLLRLRDEKPLAYAKVVAIVRQVVPFFDDFELDSSHGDVLLARREVGSDVVFDAAQASDGTLRTFALVALLGQPEEDLANILLFDEPELGLHPHAIGLIGGMIRSVSTSAQVFVATQSAELVSKFSPEDVVVVDRRGRGSSMERLDAGPLTAWLEEYTLGELWQKNLFGGRPRR